MLTRASISLFASVVLVSATACKSSDSGAPPQSATVETTAAGTSGATGGDGFGILRAIHMVEVDHGNLAQKKASDPRVKAFAEKVVADHKQRMAKDDQLMSGLGIQARDTQASAQIKSAAAQQTDRLDSLSGAAFDDAYLDEQITYYRMVIDTFDRDLIPNAQDPEIKRVLQEARVRANGHLQEAQDLRSSIAGASRP